MRILDIIELDYATRDLQIGDRVIVHDYSDDWNGVKGEIVRNDHAWYRKGKNVFQIAINTAPGIFVKAWFDKKYLRKII